MHVDWSCYACLKFRGPHVGEQQVFAVRDFTGPLAGFWRFPGGPRMAGETDPVTTLIHRFHEQTGMLLRPHQICRLTHQNKKAPERLPELVGVRQTYSERFYGVTIPIELYISRSDPVQPIEMCFFPRRGLERTADFSPSHLAYLPAIIPFHSVEVE